MNEQDIRRIIREEMDKNYRSGAPRVAPHNHDGNNNLRVNQKDLIQNTKFVALLRSNASEVFSLDFVTNPTSLMFYGFAANNAGGGGATQRAIINGNVQIGNCIIIGAQTEASSIKNNGQKASFIQMSNSMFINETGPAFRVASNVQYFAYATDGSSDLAIAAVTGVTNNSITIETSLASGWQISGAFLII